MNKVQCGRLGRRKYIWGCGQRAPADKMCERRRLCDAASGACRRDALANSKIQHVVEHPPANAPARAVTHNNENTVLLTHQIYTHASILPVLFSSLSQPQHLSVFYVVHMLCSRAPPFPLTPLFCLCTLISVHPFLQNHFQVQFSLTGTSP